MKYTSFQISNFKGIKDTTVNLTSQSKAGVFCFVGLNESGKTTILEAIHSFSPDFATSELVGGDEGNGVPFTQRVPRHLISEFTGDISVIATVAASPEERLRLIGRIKKELNLEVSEDFPSVFVFERHQRFENGDFKQSYFTLRTDIEIKSKGQRKFRPPSMEEKRDIKMLLYGYTPDIAYFPTFVFDFPKKVFLTERGSRLDAFYRTVFQDILDFDDRGHTIAKDITRRVREKKFVIPWLQFLSLWSKNDDRSKIQHVMDRASAAVTKLVFGRWNEIFGEDAKGKEVAISFEIDEGEIEDDRGNKSKTLQHDVYITFQIRDGTRRFNVNDRSLGFRWFFAFMLLTQFRAARKSTRPLLFLFDEPASNLHAAAQQKLIDSFPEITEGEHRLLYTTHSHYMVEPKWLEQTYIVTN